MYLYDAKSALVGQNLSSEFVLLLWFLQILLELGLKLACVPTLFVRLREGNYLIQTRLLLLRFYGYRQVRGD